MDILQQVNKLQSKTKLQTLVIDDDRQHCEAVSRVLRRFGCSVTKAYTLEQARKITEKSKFDVVFLEQRLGNDGDAEKYLEYKKQQTSPPAVIITGNYIPAHISAYFQRKEASTAVQKPFYQQQCGALFDEALISTSTA